MFERRGERLEKPGRFWSDVICSRLKGVQKNIREGGEEGKEDAFRRSEKMFRFSPLLCDADDLSISSSTALVQYQPRNLPSAKTSGTLPPSSESNRSSTSFSLLSPPFPCVQYSSSSSERWTYAVQTQVLVSAELPSPCLPSSDGEEE